VSLQRLHVALVAQLADGLVVRTGDQGGNAPVPVAVQLLYRLLCGVAVGNGHGGIFTLGQRTVAVGVGAADKGNVQQCQIGGGVVKAAAQKNDAPQTLFPLHDGAAFHLIVTGADLLHDHGEAGVGDGAFDGADDVGVKGVGHAADDQADGVGFGANQVTGAVVGNVVAGLDSRQHLAAHIIADVRPVVQHAGNGADADTALPGYILDRHNVVVPPTVRSV